MEQDSFLYRERFKVFFSGIVALILALTSCQSGYSGKVETITIAVSPLEQNALLYIADSQNLFAHNGLNVVFKDYDTGTAALNGLLKGEAEIAEASEFPFVRAAFRGESIAVIASNDKFENDYLVARKDRGIKAIADLKGKRIGVARQTIAEFYLGRLLELNDIKLEEVVLVNTAPAQFVDAVESSDVDALIGWQPYISQILAKQADRVVLWPAQNNQAAFGILVSDRRWLTGHSKTVERFLRALFEAEDFSAHYPDQAKSIVQKRLNYDGAYVSSVWHQHQFSLGLGFSLLVAMNDEARWMISHQMNAGKQAPNFGDYIYTDGLLVVKARAVDNFR